LGFSKCLTRSKSLTNINCRTPGVASNLINNLSTGCDFQPLSIHFTWQCLARVDRQGDCRTRPLCWDRRVGRCPATTARPSNASVGRKTGTKKAGAERRPKLERSKAKAPSGLPPAAPAPAARVPIVAAVPAPPSLLDLRLTLCKSRELTEAAAGGRRAQRRRRGGKAEARRKYKCNHGRTHVDLLGFWVQKVQGRVTRSSPTLFKQSLRPGAR
jgi:hypothetical protein